MPLDDGQQVVKIVSDASRQLPNRLHFLRLAQLFLQAALFRNILGDPAHVSNLTRGLFQRKRAVADPSHRPVRSHNPVNDSSVPSRIVPRRRRS